MRQTYSYGDSINSPYIHAANVENFQSLVIKIQNEVPFWLKVIIRCKVS